jgi:tripartite-type tricarboxylate transporter receptor subunit TctC
VSQKFLTMLRAAAVAMAALACWPALGADAYPSKPIKIIVNHAAGTILDVYARRIGNRLEQSVGQTVIVENSPGAGGTIGADHLAKSAPDGYTIALAAAAELVVAPAFYRTLPYDTLRDFAAITRAGESSAVLVVNPSLGVKTLQDLVALAKRTPGKLTCASFGNGTIAQLLLLQLNRLTGASITHVPYKDGGIALSDVVGGTADMMFNWATTTDPFTKAGKLIPVIIAGTERLPSLPNVPAATELGLDGLAFKGWSAFVAPARTPRPIIERLNRELVQALEAPEVKAHLESLGGKVTPSTPEELAAQLRAELPRAAELVRITNAQID